MLGRFFRWFQFFSLNDQKCVVGGVDARVIHRTSSGAIKTADMITLS